MNIQIWREIKVNNQNPTLIVLHFSRRWRDTLYDDISYITDIAQFTFPAKK